MAAKKTLECQTHNGCRYSTLSVEGLDLINGRIKTYLPPYFILRLNKD